MLRAMYSGISGLKNHQTKLDVIGNNISNVNTYGFKKGRVVFKDLISQTTSGASGATATRGGINPKQIGLGSQISTIDTIHSGGSLQTTSRVEDLALSGDGYFMVADSNGAPDETGTITEPGFSNILFTRAGNFDRDSNGYLKNSDGKYLVGYANAILYDATSTESNAAADKDATVGAIEAGINIYDEVPGAGAPIKIPVTAQSMTIGQDGTVNYVDANGFLQYAGAIALAKFSNTGGLEKTGNNYYQVTENSGAPYAQFGTQDGLASINSGFLEMSNVDLSEEFTEMIVAQRGFRANSRIITTSDQILEELVNLKR